MVTIHYRIESNISHGKRPMGQSPGETGCKLSRVLSGGGTQDGLNAPAGSCNSTRGMLSIRGVQQTLTARVFPGAGRTGTPCLACAMVPDSQKESGCPVSPWGGVSSLRMCLESQQPLVVPVYTLFSNGPVWEERWCPQRALRTSVALESAPQSYPGAGAGVKSKKLSAALVP